MPSPIVHEAEIVEGELRRAGVQGPEVGQLSERIVAQIRHTVHSGPLPLPELFARYDEVCPGAGREILDMAVRAQKHAHSMDERSLRSEVIYRNLGIVMAAVVVVSMVVGALVCAVVGQEKAAIALGCAATLSTLAGVFVRGRGLFEKAENGDPKPPAQQTAQKKSNRQNKRGGR